MKNLGLYKRYFPHLQTSFSQQWNECTALPRSLTHLFNLRSCGEMCIEKPQLFEKSTELAPVQFLTRWRCLIPKSQPLFTNKANLDIGWMPNNNCDLRDRKIRSFRIITCDIYSKCVKLGVLHWFSNVQPRDTHASWEKIGSRKRADHNRIGFVRRERSEFHQVEIDFLSRRLRLHIAVK